MQDNYRWLEGRAGVPVTAVVKADAYRLGAVGVVRYLLDAGCRAFAVSSWREAAALGALVPDLIVLHGFRPEDEALAAALPHCRPVLSTVRQVAAWRDRFPGRPADLMVDTGMNRLGLSMSDMGAVGDVAIDTVHSHFACADEPGHPMNDVQIARFEEVVAHFPATRHILANTAGVCIGRKAAFSGVRPGIGLYGGRPRPDAALRQVVFPEAQLLQLRTVEEGETVGYGRTHAVARKMVVGTVHIGYADGLPRLLGPALRFSANGRTLPAIGRVSMDLITVDATGGGLAEGDWLTLGFDLVALAAHGPLGQYELLTALSPRYERRWS